MESERKEQKKEVGFFFDTLFLVYLPHCEKKMKYIVFFSFLNTPLPILTASLAIQDMFAKLVELNKLWTEIQLTFVEQIKDFRVAFESILGEWRERESN